jgi:hypothetical protein
MEGIRPVAGRIYAKDYRELAAVFTGGARSTLTPPAGPPLSTQSGNEAEQQK